MFVLFLFGLALTAGAVIWMRWDVRRPDSSGTRVPLFTSAELSPLPDGPSRLLNRAATVSAPLRRTLRRDLFRSEKKPSHGAMRVAAVFWLGRNDMLRPRCARWFLGKATTTEHVAVALRHLLGTTPASEVNEAEAAVVRAIAELSRLLAQPRFASEPLRDLRQTLKAVLVEHRLRVPPVVAFLNGLAPQLGDFFLRESTARHGITIPGDTILVTAGLPGQVVNLIENVVPELDRPGAFRRFQRRRKGQTLGFDETFFRNRRANVYRTSVYDGDLLRAYEDFLAASASSA